MPLLNTKQIAQLKSEADKVSYIQRLLTEKVSHTEVRKEIGKVWGIGKSARNEKFNKFSKLPKGSTTKDAVKVLAKKDAGVIVQNNGSKIYTANSENKMRGADPKKVLKIDGEKAVAEVKGVADIVTVADLIAYAQIDMDVWECTKTFVNCYNEIWQVKAEFKKKVDEQSLKSLIETFEKQAIERAPKNFKINPAKGSGDGLYVLSIQDLHIGKLSHGKQTLWGDFSLPIAKQYYREAAEELINKAPVREIGKVLIIIGSDMIHYENQRVETSSGTKIEGDSRWHKVFDESCQLVADTVELLASQFDVEVMVVAGNHANLSEYAMGAYIKAFFRFHPNVNVNNEPSNRKYFGHGKTLVGFSHGHGVKKLEDLGAVMMRERMDTISNFKNLYWITGHKHTFTQMKDERGIRIFVSAALCAPDQWHSENNFAGNIQSAEGYLFSPETGLSQIIFSSPVNVK